MTGKLIAFEDARATVLERVAPLAGETVPLAAALGRVLAAEVRAPEDVPAFDNSANCFDLNIRYRRWLAGTGHKAIYSRRREDLKPALDAAFQKYVTRKQRQREGFGPVFPMMSGCVKRKERVKSLVR